jgi:hypothetical protein
MKLEIIQKTNMRKICDIKIGECFQYAEKFYMRTNGGYQSCPEAYFYSVEANGSEALFSNPTTEVELIPDAKWVC